MANFTVSAVGMGCFPHRRFRLHQDGNWREAQKYDKMRKARAKPKWEESHWNGKLEWRSRRKTCIKRVSADCFQFRSRRYSHRNFHICMRCGLGGVCAISRSQSLVSPIKIMRKFLRVLRRFAYSAHRISSSPAAWWQRLISTWRFEPSFVSAALGCPSAFHLSKCFSSKQGKTHIVITIAAAVIPTLLGSCLRARACACLRYADTRTQFCIIIFSIGNWRDEHVSREPTACQSLHALSDELWILYERCSCGCQKPNEC